LDICSPLSSVRTVIFSCSSSGNNSNRMRSLVA
jgi:hypothetical protein